MTLVDLLRKHFTSVILFYLILSFPIFLLNIGGENNRPIIGILYAGTFYLSLLPINWLIKIFGKGHPQSKAFGYIFTGALVAALATTVGQILQFVFKVSTFGLTTPLFFLGYVLTFIGLAMEIKAIGINWKKRKVTVKTVSYILLTIFIALIFVLEKQFKLFSGGTVLQYVDLSFVLADFILIMLSGFLLRISFEYQGGYLSKAWFLIFASFILIALADLFLVPYDTQDVSNIWQYNLVELSWITANLIFCLGIFRIGDSILRVQDKIKLHMRVEA